jgi:hypothetical protein
VLTFIAGCGTERPAGATPPGVTAPPASALPLGADTTELGSQAEFDSVLAAQGGPHEYYRDILVQGLTRESAEQLIRREVDKLPRGGWVYSGSIGVAADREAILVRAGTRGATSYVYNRSHQICATLDTYADSDLDDDPALARLAAKHQRRDLLWITLSHEVPDYACALPTELR